MGKLRNILRTWGRPTTKDNGIKIRQPYPCKRHAAVMKYASTIAGIVLFLIIIEVICFSTIEDIAEDSNTQVITIAQSNQVDKLLDQKNIVDMTATTELKDMAEDIRNDILALDNINSIEDSMTNGDIPPEVEAIFKKYLQGKSTIKGLDPEINNIFVSTSEGIVADYSHVYAYNNDNTRTWEVENLHEKNVPLFSNSIQAILNQDTTIYYAEQANRADNIQYDYFPEIMDIKTFHEIFNKYGLDGFRGYTFLVPVYIDKDGDVFGKPDIINGHKVKNNKLIIIQRYSLYDYVMLHSGNNIFFSDIQYYFTKIHKANMIIKISIMGLSVFILITLTVLLNYIARIGELEAQDIQNAIKKNIE